MDDCGLRWQLDDPFYWNTRIFTFVDIHQRPLKVWRVNLYRKSQPLSGQSWNWPQVWLACFLKQEAYAKVYRQHYLSAMLKSLTGKTTQQHIHLALTDKAKVLLNQTGLTTAEIAYRLGFEHPQSFNRLFKQRTNLSLVQYRDRLRGNWIVHRYLKGLFPSASYWGRRRWSPDSWQYVFDWSAAQARDNACEIQGIAVLLSVKDWTWAVAGTCQTRSGSESGRTAPVLERGWKDLPDLAR